MGVCRDAQIYSRRDCDLELHIIHCELVRIRALQSRFSSVSIQVLSFSSTSLPSTKDMEWNITGKWHYKRVSLLRLRN